MAKLGNMLEKQRFTKLEKKLDDKVTEASM